MDTLGPGEFREEDCGVPPVSWSDPECCWGGLAMTECQLEKRQAVWRPQGWLELALRPEVPCVGLSVSGLKEDHLSSEFCLVPAVFHPTDGYATVDRRERRTLGSDSTVEASEKELLKVSDSNK